MIPGIRKARKKPTPGGQAISRDSDSERETGSPHQSTTKQPSGSRHGTSTTAQPDARSDPKPASKPKSRKRRPGDPSVGGISLGGQSDDDDDPGAESGDGSHPIGQGNQSGGSDDRPNAGSQLPSTSGSTLKPKPKPKPKPKERDDRSEEDGDVTLDEPSSGGQPSGLTDQERLRKGLKNKPGVNPDEDKDVQKIDLGNEPERIPAKKDDASAGSKVPDAFDDEGDDQLTRLQRRINAIRKGGRPNGVALADDDADIELVDTGLAEKLEIANERQKRMKKTLMVDDPEMQSDIANALAKALKPKWPGYVAMGFKVAFFIGDVALIVNGVTDEFYLIDIPAKEIIEGAVNLYKRATETPEEKEAAIRNGRGESAAQLKERRKRGKLALMELTGKENLNQQQLETYDRLRVYLAMQRKVGKAEGTQKK
ncbi:hypothetical protein ACET3X_005613 [Alternaria dauci]|uniref:Uncharacterized protein n=1 Tax=Alternaria dauci TaxID=48095 RepID=A0ABR3UKT1_9PLEO